MRAVLVGAVESTRVTLEALVDYGSAPCALVTLPLDKSSRHSDWVDFEDLAGGFNVPLLRYANINDAELLDRLRDLRPDYIFVIGWSQICRSDFLALPSVGCIGYHPAPLPENRGRAVIPWTILQGRRETGASLFWLDEGMDSGDILAQERFPLADDETARTLYDRHLEVLRELLTSVFADLDAGTAPRLSQDHAGASYCARRTANDGLIDWEQPARAVWTLIRAVGDPYPGAFTFRRGSKLIVLEADYIGQAPYWGLPGQVQAIGPEGALVQCGDSEHVRLRRVELDDRAKPGTAANILRLHERLGLDWLELATTAWDRRS